MARERSASSSACRASSRALATLASLSFSPLSSHSSICGSATAPCSGTAPSSIDPRLRGRVTFPVRANFFYEGPLGLAVCVFMSGGSMFPPFFRSADKMPFNRYSLSLVIERMKERNWIVGFHPEGTRNKTDDPYKLLPAQPGVGEVALKARPVVLPAFIHGLTNSVWQELKLMLRRDLPINAVFGAPIDLSGFPKDTRLSHHKRCADLFAERIAELGQEEKKLSATSPAAPP